MDVFLQPLFREPLAPDAETCEDILVSLSEDLGKILGFSKKKGFDTGLSLFRTLRRHLFRVCCVVETLC